MCPKMRPVGVAKKRKKGQKLSCVKLAICSDHPRRRRPLKFCVRGRVREVVIYFKFHEHRSRGLRAVEGRKSPSPIDLAHGLYNSLYYRTSRDIAPQAAYRSCSGAFCVTERAGIQPIERRLSPCPCLPFNGLHPRNPCNYIWITTHLPTPGDVRLSWPGWLTDSGHFPMKWSHVNHRSGIDQGKSASQRPTL